MRAVNLILALALMMVLASCGAKAPPKILTYDGPPITSIQVQKANRKMYLLSGNQVVKSFDIALGFAPVGHKEYEGDGKTPEGTYWIDRRNPNSAFHLSLGVSYPNADDRIHALANGKLPGGDIFIHGDSPWTKRQVDWTAGCIAVTDEEIEEIYAMVREGTVIQILP
ncbi:L,D-transpeptidase family protein [Falsirhodobacter algicola]|uniref:L,D-transpeptidase family protein n=1 Tax=Falsirhodobacter algicola TaxID=2692330 RepID=A0A8J8SL15_9RHOB|nr:L,D-transpeptidase family protein [Falsirhodobacter algicola]QUS36072.1 L,D-transpeptidase family protein [Falsirhodobacter algicola]